MDRELVERLAKEAGFIYCTAKEPPYWGADAGTFIADCTSAIETLIALVAEECAKVAEGTTEQGAPDMYCETKAYGAAAAIRAKFGRP